MGALLLVCGCLSLCSISEGFTGSSLGYNFQRSHISGRSQRSVVGGGVLVWQKVGNIFGEEEEEEEVDVIPLEGADADMGDDIVDDVIGPSKVAKKAKKKAAAKEEPEELSEEEMDDLTLIEEILEENPDIPMVEMDSGGNIIGKVDPYEGMPPLPEEEEEWPEVAGEVRGMDDPPDAPWRVKAEKLIRDAIATTTLECYDILWTFHKLEVTVILPGFEEGDVEAGYVDSEQLMAAIRAVNSALEDHEQELAVLTRHELVIATPGSKDILTTDREFKAFKGFEVIVQTGGPFKNNRVLTGTLVERTADEVKINQKGRIVSIPVAMVDEVRLPKAETEAGEWNP
ncbi:unnamed protein product [Chrysoparadoxa australica]